jgi:predicted transcriptional regulator
MVKMVKKRFKDQILADILKTCDGNGASKTKIVYAAAMNFKTIEPYLILLSDAGLLEKEGGNRIIYKTTPKGKEALLHICALFSLMTKCVNKN